MNPIKLSRIVRITIGLAISLGVLIGCGAPAPAQPTATSLPPDQLPRPNTTPGPDDPQIYLFEPQDGDLVTSPVLVRYGVSGFDADSSRYQIMLIVDRPCVTPGQAVAADDFHRPFKLRTVTQKIELPAGPHRLCLQALDQSGQPVDGPGMTFVVDITVQ